jgi:hypothetical protein
MNLYEIITNAYPELDVAAFDPSTGIISLRDDADGIGAYISKWEYEQPIPDGLTLGKPSA